MCVNKVVSLLLQVQRSLSVAVESEISNVSAKSSQTAPALSRALARVLSTTKSKENEADTKSVHGYKDFTEDENEGGMFKNVLEFKRPF